MTSFVFQSTYWIWDFFCTSAHVRHFYRSRLFLLLFFCFMAIHQTLVPCSAVHAQQNLKMFKMACHLSHDLNLQAIGHNLEDKIILAASIHNSRPTSHVSPAVAIAWLQTRLRFPKTAPLHMHAWSNICTTFHWLYELEDLHLLFRISYLPQVSDPTSFSFVPVT